MKAAGKWVDPFDDMSRPPFDLSSVGIDTRWLDVSLSDRRLLLVVAHPDDESFSNPGTIARYAASGVTVHCVCATRGELGTIEPELLRGRAGVSELRTSELLCAADALGMAAIHFLGYRDSGMEGEPENLAAGSLHQAALEDVTRKIVATMRVYRPHVVITFAPSGGYRHPDHVKINQATLPAFEAAELGPGKLYYLAGSVTALRIAIAAMRLLRRDPRKFGRNKDVDLVRMLDEATPTTTVIDVSAFLQPKIRAARCHRSQTPSLPPGPIMRIMGRTERFARVVPPWRSGESETDLFSSI